MEDLQGIKMVRTYMKLQCSLALKQEPLKTPVRIPTELINNFQQCRHTTAAVIETVKLGLKYLANSDKQF